MSKRFHTYAASNLPDGVSLDPVTGQISGTISAAGAYEVTVTATDPIVNVTDTISFTWTITIPAGPIPRGSDFVVDESGSLYVPANLGVLANAYNPASVALTAELTTGVDPSAGTLDFHDDGSFTFVAASGWDGMASFEFHLAQNPDAAAQVFIAAQDRLQGDTALYFVAFQSNANILNDGKFTATSQSPHGPDFLTNAAPMRFGDSANYMQWLDLNTNGEIDGAALSSGNVQNAWRVDHQYPASFTRNTAISLHVGFKIAIRDLDFWRNADRWITVGATGPGELTLGSTHTVYLGVTRQTLGNVSAYVLGTGPVVEAPGEIPPFNQATGWVDMDGPLPNATAYYSSFQLDWRIHVSNRWITPSAHVSSNEVFVTLAPPNGSAANAYQEADARKPAIYHSVFYAGIWGSIGATNQDQLVQYVFAGFQSLTMTRADGTAMKYYGNWTTAGHYINTRLLIQEGDGNCYAWAHLLIDALNAQGGNYTSNGNGKTIFAKNPTYDYFLVKSWQIPQGPGPYPEGFVNFNIPVAGAAGIRWDASGYIWGPNPEVISPQDGSNAPGQNQANPMSAFANHSVVEIDGKWYDPSYGLIYDNNLGIGWCSQMALRPLTPDDFLSRKGIALARLEP
ncbi:MAG: putative Ig domain-containing protein [Planctomycetes bacterium]|nr:putative Ig domain-containing protein [Planctomycetota bacterium]